MITFYTEEFFMLSQDERVARATIYEKNSRLLFEQWKHKACFGTVDHKNDVFVRDGVVCPQKWFSADIRPLFLLKEAYGGESDWDLISDHLMNYCGLIDAYHFARKEQRSN